MYLFFAVSERQSTLEQNTLLASGGVARFQEFKVEIDLKAGIKHDRIHRIEGNKP